MDNLIAWHILYVQVTIFSQVSRQHLLCCFLCIVTGLFFMHLCSLAGVRNCGACADCFGTYRGVYMQGEFDLQPYYLSVFLKFNFSWTHMFNLYFKSEIN